MAEKQRDEIAQRVIEQPSLIKDLNTEQLKVCLRGFDLSDDGTDYELLIRLFAEITVAKEKGEL